MIKSEVESQEFRVGLMLRALGWIPSVFIGGPSTVIILQSLFVDHSFTPIVQGILSEYERLLSLFGLILEPPFELFLQIVKPIFSYDLVVGEHWRTLFVLASIFNLAAVRGGIDRYELGTELKSSYFERTYGAKRAMPFSQKSVRYITVFLWTAFFCLVAGTIPVDGTWWQQGLIAALVVAPLIAIEWRHLESILLAIFVSLGLFAIGVVLWLMPFVSEGVGVIAVFVLLIFGAREIVSINNWTSIFDGRRFAWAQLLSSLYIAGPLLGGALIYLADWYLRMP